MQQLLNLSGTIAGVFGIIVCIVAGLTRASGLYYLAGYEATTLFTVGIGLVVVACLFKLEALSAYLRAR